MEYSLHSSVIFNGVTTTCTGCTEVATSLVFTKIINFVAVITQG